MARTKPQGSDLDSLIRELTLAKRVERGEVVQSLWGGYGEVLRYELEGGDVTTVVVKHVAPPHQATRGSRDLSHARKLKSYRVEKEFYLGYAGRCDEHCRVARCYGARTLASEQLFVFEDLELAGFCRRANEHGRSIVGPVLSWLAAFHASFLGTSPVGLWKHGTYWHLETRPDELKRVRNRELRAWASKFSERLSACRYQTLLHGDAKSDNFLFTESLTGLAVAAVDFQYVGGGTGMKDVAYFLSSVYSPAECEREAAPALEVYFAELKSQLALRQPGVDPGAVEAEWRALYPFAWADFQRFLEGWAPGAYDDDPYAHRMIRLARQMAES